MTHRQRGAGIVVGISVLTVIAAHYGILAPFESFALGKMQAQLAPRRIDDIVVVAINEHDYETTFKETSPLDVAHLGAIISQIIAGHPALLAVDLDTDPRTIKIDLQGREAPPIIWTASHSSIEKHEVTLSPKTQERLAAVPWGLTTFPLGRDGVVRSYRRTYQMKELEVDTLPWAMTKAICQQRSYRGCASPHEEGAGECTVIFNFAGDRYDIRVDSIKSLEEASKEPGWSGEHGALFNRIVLLGGTFEAARDRYMTPIGALSGVELHARTLATELNRGGIRPINELLMLLAELVSGFVLWEVFHRYKRRALRPVLALVPVLAFGSSLVAFFALSHWLNFIPVIFATILHELYEATK